MQCNVYNTHKRSQSNLYMRCLAGESKRGIFFLNFFFQKLKNVPKSKINFFEIKNYFFSFDLYMKGIKIELFQRKNIFSGLKNSF